MALRVFALFFLLSLVYPLQARAEEEAVSCDPDATCSHALSIFDAPKYPADFAHFRYVNPGAPKGGTMRYSAIGTFDSFNAHILKGIPAVGLPLTQDTLLVESADEPFTKYGLIAETIELANDKSWVGFHLNKKARWHNGKPITAEDIVFSFETIMAKGHPFYRSYFSDVKTVEARSKRYIRFTFKHNSNRELPMIIGQLPIIPKLYYLKHDFSKTSLEPPLGSGPYKVGAFKAGKFVRYERMKDYWGADLPVNKGRFNFDTIQYDFYRDTTVAFEAFKAGEYDVRLENIAKNWVTGYAFPAVKEKKVKLEVIDHDIPSGMQGFVFNTRKNKFKDRRVREAIALMLDFQWMNKTLFFNTYIQSDSFFENSEFASAGLPSDAELALLEPFRDQLPKAVFDTPFRIPATDGSGNIRPLLRQAKQLLEEAGWVVKDGVLINSQTGKPMQVEFLFSSPSHERVANSIVKNLERLGITATIRTIDSAQYIKREEAFDFDIVMTVFSQSSFPGNEQRDYWHSTRADIKGSKNLAGIKNPAVDAIVERIPNAQSREELTTLCHALDRILLHEWIVIPNWHLGKFRLAYWDKFGRPKRNPPYALMLDAWWDKALVQ